MTLDEQKAALEALNSSLERLSKSLLAGFPELLRHDPSDTACPQYWNPHRDCTCTKPQS